MSISDDILTFKNQHHDPFYRLGVGLMIINKENQVFVGSRADMKAADMPVAWQMPQGGIDKDELPIDAALREMTEEIGTDNVYLLAESGQWLSYDFPKELAGTLWGGRFVGQRQKWFLFRFLGKDSDINIQTKHPEFKDWRWVDPQLLPDLIVPFKKDLYKQLLVEFSEFL